MKRVLMLTVAVAVVCPGRAHAGDAKPRTLHIWPGKPPGETGKIDPEKVTLPKADAKRPIKIITNVTEPTVTVFRPSKEKNTGAAVVIAPGGGYNILAWDLEGEEVARWLNSIGVTGIVLKYRVPRRPGTKGTPPQALMDAQRALSLIRSMAPNWEIDPQRIGMLGFSAGGHLTAWASTNFDKRCYDPVDEIDKVSCRPDFAVLIYPAYMVKKEDQLARDIRVSKESPQTFFAHASDDPISPKNSVGMYLALRKAGVPAEMHIYASGGHGFGLRPTADPCSTWPQRCADWMRARGLLKGSSSR